MGNVKVYDIAVRLGCCAECLVNAVNESGIDTFSSVNKFEEIFAETIAQDAEFPCSYDNTWVYMCDKHINGMFDDLEVEILDVID